MTVNGKLVAELRSVTCHMGLLIVTCHPTQLSERGPSLLQRDRWGYSIYLPRRDGRL